MGFYVTIRKNDRQTIFALGPFNRHGDALRAVGHVRRHVETAFPNDRDVDWLAWGTSRVKRGPMPVGRFNQALGLPAGRIAESTLTPNWWWIEGEQPEQPKCRRQRNRDAA